jgi:hypothetical protein
MPPEITDTLILPSPVFQIQKTVMGYEEFHTTSATKDEDCDQQSQKKRLEKVG